MSSILNISTRALIANQAALQTAGNNIANVNTPGYSRQSVVLQDVAGQFSGNGYYGKGVDILTVLRQHSDFLTRQSMLATAVSAADTKRLDQLKQLEDVFQGGTTGLGASVSDMLNSFSDIAAAPTDLTARSVTVTRADEMTARFRAASTRLDDLAQGVSSDLTSDIQAVNSLAGRIAKINDDIGRAMGTGHSPNDLLDQRDQLITELNKYVQTTSIPADDGSIGIFLGGSQPLVLGNTVTPIGLTKDEFGDPSKVKVAMLNGGQSMVLDEATLGGGEISGLLKFQNTDLVDARNLLGRMAVAIGTAMNDQNKLGIDLTGAAGGNFFNLAALPDGLPASSNTGTASLQVSVQSNPTSGATSLVASNYEISFTGANTGNITRLSDGQVTSFAAVPIQIDGLDLTVSAGALAGDRFLITPFRAEASSITTAFTSPRALAMSSPVAASAGVLNQGTLTVGNLIARTVPPPPALTLTFTSASTYTRSDEVPVANTTVFSYSPGQAIEATFPNLPATVPPTYTPPLTGWSLTLKGTPAIGDTFTVQPNLYPTLDGGNADAMMALRDVAMFDGTALTDGYAGAMSQIGTKVQGATYAAQISSSILVSAEKDRTSVTGVNLDEEAAKLLQYQQSYQASAKMLQIAQSVFDTLLQTVGR